MNKRSPSSITFRAKFDALTSTDQCADPAPAIALAQSPALPVPCVPTPMHGALVQVLALLRKYSTYLLMPLLKPRKHRRKLQLLEMQQLGEKRFVAIVRVGRQKFLIGGAASSVLLLAEIDSRKATILPPHPLNQESA
jgi:flagellar biogenesis protein FliO